MPYEVECGLLFRRNGKLVLTDARGRLLRSIEEEGSLPKAASSVGISCERAKAVVRDIELSTGLRVVSNARGRGRSDGHMLTSAGRELLLEFEAHQQAFEAQVAHRFRNPVLAVDGILVEEGRILLVKRGNPPFKDEYVLPGGFVEYGELVEEAVRRELLEETGLKTHVHHLFGVYSSPDRDPRGHTVSIVHVMRRKGGKLRSGDDASDAGFFPLDKLPPLAFDHLKIVQDYVEEEAKASRRDG